MKYFKYNLPIPFIDIFLIKWNPKCITKIHNHSKSGCYMFILYGNIKEEIFTKKLSLKNVKYYSTFDKSYINDDIGYHRILNDNNYSYSLHIYHPKNHVTKYYN
jgi:hypothetical protein